MSEIVRGRTKGYMTVENFIEDGLLEIGSIDLAGFYGALKRFIDRRTDEDGKAAMPWTIDMFCRKFKIGKQRFYKLSEKLWQVGLLDVEKESGVIDSEKGTIGWRNKYVVHDYPEYEGPLCIVRKGTYKYKKGPADEETSDNKDFAPGQEQEGKDWSEQKSMDDLKEDEGEVLYRNTFEQTFGGSSNAGIPKSEIPAMEIPAMEIPAMEIPRMGIPDMGISDKEIPNTGIPAAGIPAAERYIKDKRSKTQELEKIKEGIHTSNQDNKNRAHARVGERPVDNVDIVENTNTQALRKILTDAGFEGTEVEVQYITVWAHIFPPEMIGYAVKKAVLSSKKSLPYIGGIFESWIKKGVGSIEQAEKETRYDSAG